MNQQKLDEILEDHWLWLNEKGGKRADLNHANLRDAYLTGAYLRGANLRDADLRGAYLTGANLNHATLTGAKGLKSSVELMDELFESTPEGWIVYKCFGQYRISPEKWLIEPGSILEEEVDPDRRLNCSWGINFGTRKWHKADHHTCELWKCLIPRDAEVIVPHATNGKARCDRLELIGREEA